VFQKGKLRTRTSIKIDLQIHHLPGDNGDLIGIVKLHEQFLLHLMADFIFIQVRNVRVWMSGYDDVPYCQHGDLHSMLLEHAVQEGVEVRYNSKVINVNSDIVAVTLDGGENIFSDVIIGADGSHSLVRTIVAGERISETRERDISLNFTIPTEVMKAHDDLRSLTTNSDVRLLKSTDVLTLVNLDTVSVVGVVG
jgi:salicylate hydroxylase